MAASAPPFSLDRVPYVGGFRVVPYGNSFASPDLVASGVGTGAFANQTTGFCTMMQAMSGGAIRYDGVLNFGVAGETSTQILARLPAVLASASLYDGVVIPALYANDMGAGIAPATSLANNTAICEALINAGKTPILTTPYPPNSFGSLSAAQQKQCAWANLLTEEYVRSRRSLIGYIDLWRDWVDATATTGAAATGILYDTRHPAFLGVFQAVRRWLNNAGARYDGPFLTQAQWDIYDATNNPRGNMLASVNANAPYFFGTGGTINSGGTGSIATGYSLSRFGGTGSLTLSKESAVSGFDSQGQDRQIIDARTLAGSWSGSFFAASIAPPAGVNTFECSMEVEFASAAGVAVGFGGVNLYAQKNSGGTAAIALNVGDNIGSTPWPNGKYLFRTPPLSIVGGDTNIQFAVPMSFAAGAVGTMYFGAPVMRPLS